MKTVLLAILMLLSTSAITYTLSDFGVNTIEVEPLSVKSIVIEKRLNLNGTFEMRIKLYGKGSVQVRLSVNNNSLTIGLNEEKAFTIKIEEKFRIEMTIINYGLETAKIYSNSTIEIIPQPQENMTLSPIAFYLTMLIPLVMLFIYERKKPYEEPEAKAEEVIVI